MALLSGVSPDGSPLPPPRKASALPPLPVTPRLTTSDAVGTTRPAASTTSTRTKATSLQPATSPPAWPSAVELPTPSLNESRSAAAAPVVATWLGLGSGLGLELAHPN